MKKISLEERGLVTGDDVEGIGKRAGVKKNTQKYKYALVKENLKNPQVF